MFGGNFSNDDGDGNENVNKTTNLHVHHTCLVHFSAVSARLLRENAKFYVLWKTYKQATTNFSFSFWTLVRSPRNQLQGNSPNYFWHFKQTEINSESLKKREFMFNDVYRYRRRRRRRC